MLVLEDAAESAEITDIYQYAKRCGHDYFDNIVVVTHSKDRMLTSVFFRAIAYFLEDSGNVILYYQEDPTIQANLAHAANTGNHSNDVYSSFGDTFTIAQIQRYSDWTAIALFKADRSLQSRVKSLQKMVAKSQALHSQAEREAEHLKENYLREVDRHRKYVALLERQVKNNKETLSFQLGNLLLNSTKSASNFFSLPKRLFELRALARNRRQIQSQSEPQVTPTKKIGAKELAAFAEEYKAGGIQQLVVAIKMTAESVDPIHLATYFLQVGKKLYEAGFTNAERDLVDYAFNYSMAEPVVRGAFWALMRAQDFDAIPGVVSGFEATLSRKPSTKEQNTLAKLKSSPAYQTGLLKKIPTSPIEQIEFTPNSVCYFLHNSLPYSSGGYATRAQGVAYGMKQAGFDVTLVTRPGFPMDVKPELTIDDIPIEETIDDLNYVRMLYPARKGLNTNDYILQAADEIELLLRKRKPQIVMAASNYYTGLPALIAARRLGLKFVYELRGFWEITRLSREPEFSTHPSYLIQRRMEAEMVNHADVSFTLTQPMREEMKQRGCDIDQIHLLPNSCTPEHFEPRGRDKELAIRLGIPEHVPVIGYIGTFAIYEGLEDLAKACAILKDHGREFRLMLVGNENASGQDRGPITTEIRRVADESGFSDWLIMPGRVPHEEVESYYSLIDIAPFPRKPWPVCEMVSPMKPLEALAMKKAVLVSSVRALVEMIQENKTGLVFEKGNIESLASQLERLLDSDQLRTELGEEGRKWVEQERTWSNVGSIFKNVIEQVAVPSR